MAALSRAPSILPIIFVFHSLIVNVCGSPFKCSTGCLCSSNSEMVACKGANLENIPWQFQNPGRILDLDLHGNSITVLDSKISSFSNLERLDLGRNLLVHIDSNVFISSARLTRISLKGNRLSNLEIGVFNGLRKLSSLDLSSNSITSLADGVFNGLASLEELDLSGNQLTNISANAFLGLHNLRILKLSNNSLFNIPALVVLTKLTSLHLGHNHIEMVPSKTFESNLNLETINLDNNNISSIEPNSFTPSEKFSCPVSLRSLSLKNNRLFSAPNISCSKNLVFLDMSGNPLKSLDQNSFRDLPHLQVLRICGMDNLQFLSNGTFNEMPHLIELSICSNWKLSRIENGAFSGLSNLRILDLHANSLETLDEDSVSSLQLDVLDLRFNKWNCDCRLQWLPKYLSENTSNKSIFYQEQTRCARPSNFADRRIIDFGRITVGCLGDTARITETVQAWEDRIFAIMMCSIITILIIVMIIVCCVCKNSYTDSLSGAYSHFYLDQRDRQLQHRRARQPRPIPPLHQDPDLLSDINDMDCCNSMPKPGSDGIVQKKVKFSDDNIC